MKDGRRKIAFLSRSISEYSGSQLWAGIAEAAVRLDVDLLCWSGGQLNRDPESFIYEYFDPSRVDGTIGWASSNADADAQYYVNLAKRPLVTLSLPIPGIPTVTVDCYTGMLEAMDHLIQVHGKKRIAYIRGPETHIYAQERYQGYRDALKRHGIPEDMRLVTPAGSFDQSWGTKAVGLFLDERRLEAVKDFDALIAVNDSTAIGAMIALQGRKFRVPEDVAVVGYNDSREARCVTPPLTSVAMPFRDQGEKALELLLRKLDGEKIPEKTELPASLVIGNSCGCVSPSVMRIDHLRDGFAPEGEKAKSKPISVSRLIPARKEEGRRQESAREAIEAILKACSDIRESGKLTSEGIERSVETLHSGYLEANRTKSRFPYLNAMSTVIRLHLEKFGNVDALHDILTSMRNTVLPAVPDLAERRFAGELFDQSRIMVSETAERMKEYQHLETSKRERLLQDIGTQLITTFDLEKLLAMLSESLPRIGIPACAVVRTDTGIAQLMMAYDENGRTRMDSEVRFDPAEHLPAGFMPNGRGAYTLVTESLGFGAIRLGYIVFRLGPQSGEIYLNVRNMFSSALYGAIILKESRDMKDLIERNLSTTKEKAAFVSERSNTMSGGLDEISLSMGKASDSVGMISKSADEVMKSSRNAAQATEKANAVVNAFAEKAREIGSVLGVITDIAEQTQLLAFNASIEAAHAGAAGRGFAVVAKEIKELVAKTMRAAQDISKLVGGIRDSTREATETIAEAVNSVNSVSVLATGITEKVREQAKISEKISKHLDAATMSSREISDAISELANSGKTEKSVASELEEI